MEQLNRELLQIKPLKERANKMSIRDIKQLDDISTTNPDLELESLCKEILVSYQNKKQVILMMGAHPIRRGNSRFIIDLIRRGIVTHIATNTAAAIHDFELSFIGATLEDVELYITDGQFGNWQETGEFINLAARVAADFREGFGATIGRMILEEEYKPMPHKDISVFAAAYKLGVPITIHKSIGYDITDQHSSADFAALGQASGYDFLWFANTISQLEGGVFLNIGSQVMGPEVYLKALSMARNLAKQKNEIIKHFTTGVFDLPDLGDWRENKDIVNYRKPESMSDPRYYFRPLKSILTRTVRDGGKSFYVPGDFSLTFPALYKELTQKQPA
ncbi:hypothetical protein KW791_03160 [Candidatus Parcubacteria bacterium]|nr:hypothetical protein [Candidatus Parcubacteria bacterium]